MRISAILFYLISISLTGIFLVLIGYDLRDSIGNKSVIFLFISFPLILINHNPKEIIKAFKIALTKDNNILNLKKSQLVFKSIWNKINYSGIFGVTIYIINFMGNISNETRLNELLLPIVIILFYLLVIKSLIFKPLEISLEKKTYKRLN